MDLFIGGHIAATPIYNLRAELNMAEVKPSRLRLG
jgi:hypothetical protein